MLDGKVVMAALAAAALTFVATRDGGASRDGLYPGRFQALTDGHSIFRLNTASGEVVVCSAVRRRQPEVVCGLEAAERAKIEEIARRAEEEIARRSERQTER